MKTVLTIILFFNFNNNPPGTIKVKNYYVDKTEILNIHWMEYIYYCQEQAADDNEIQKILPHAINTWYSLPENRYKPIVLITYEQALDYCAWRSKVVTEKLGKKVTYRLPDIKEWKEIADHLIKTDLKNVSNEIEEARRKTEVDSLKYSLNPIDKIKSRVYNYFTNVSEMTYQKGIALGSTDYQLTDLQTNLTRLIKYDNPNAFLGFRCIAETE
jgi:formylglycine-generating enzyme required for sulfatase activity